MEGDLTCVGVFLVLVGLALVGQFTLGIDPSNFRRNTAIVGAIIGTVGGLIIIISFF